MSSLKPRDRRSRGCGNASAGRAGKGEHLFNQERVARAHGAGRGGGIGGGRRANIGFQKPADQPATSQ